VRWPRGFVFPNKSKRFNNFLERVFWLLLALEVRFWELAGTILGTAPTALIAVGPSCDHQIQCEFDEDAMLDLAKDIRSLSEFKRNTVDLLDRLRKTGHPLVLTINGKAEMVVQDAEAYQALLDRVEAIEGIQRGLADVKAGRTKPARQVFARLRRKHGIPR
jgi:prevent-host-death family protein